MNGQNEEEENQRTIPQSDLDFQSQMINPVWSDDLGRELNNNLTSNKKKNTIVRKYKKGDVRVNHITGELEILNQDVEIEEPLTNLWGKLNYFTRDLRLANLDKAELNYIREDLDLAQSFLEAGMDKPFVYCLHEVANVNETSQSKGGWLRTKINTLTTESRQEIWNQPEKKDFFGRKGK